MYIFITGTAGFIGSFLTEALTSRGHRVYGIDSINDYYDINLKKARLEKCGISQPQYGREIRSVTLPGYIFRQMDLCDKTQLNEILANNHFDCMINLAAQAGVRYSLKNPEAYIQSNICGFLNLLEGCRNHNCPRLIYASSSSVYGNSQNVPFNEAEQVDHPVSIYAATKKSNELMSYTYSHLYKIHTIGLRFFTVYGPYGRPDMAPILFAGSIAADRPIRIFNNGKLARDFTYIDDIIEGIVKITEHPEQASEDTAGIPAVIYNIGHGSSMQLMDFIHILERNLGKEAQKEYVGMQPGDVYQTWADTRKLERDFHYKPTTSLEEGITRFAQWYKEYYKNL
ncbi:GDP-mannose 4,6-dehydratase [Culturomica massiliensis]|uniref:GDP-mannose 4,6-dehydratase n=1 Tax=Culturomica massiliensis TaxID=1841857 RepID=UPI002665F934|nr:GDP-mannose 4,6-dehydratase [Culturomica massiliensis]